MRVASWILATHLRPQLLRAALLSILDSAIPDGWRAEVIVGHLNVDVDAARICHELGVTAVSTTKVTGGAKRNACLARSTGELVLVADDDDMQSPLRLGEAVAAYEVGWGMSEIKEFRYLHLPWGNVVRWCGRGSPPSSPPVPMGTARSYRRGILERAKGWSDIRRFLDSDLSARIAARRAPGRIGRSTEIDGAPIANTTICVQHEGNVWSDRPMLKRGQVVMRGLYKLVGEGHWSELEDFPGKVAERLGLSA